MSPTQRTVAATHSLFELHVQIALLPLPPLAVLASPSVGPDTSAPKACPTLTAVGLVQATTIFRLDDYSHVLTGLPAIVSAGGGQGALSEVSVTFHGFLTGLPAGFPSARRRQTPRLVHKASWSDPTCVSCFADRKAWNPLPSDPCTPGPPSLCIRPLGHFPEGPSPLTPPRAVSRGHSRSLFISLILFFMFPPPERRFLS